MRNPAEKSSENNCTKNNLKREGKANLPHQPTPSKGGSIKMFNVDIVGRDMKKT